MRSFLWIVPAVMSLLLSGCGWLTGDNGYFRDRGDEYRKAQSIPPMRVPAEVKDAKTEPLYAIPAGESDALLGKEFEVPQPAPLLAEPEKNIVRIQKLGDDQWVLLDGAPSEIWPRIRAFLISNHIGIEREDVTTGQIETAWLTFKTDASKYEKYRYRIEQGVQRGSTEIYVRQIGYLQTEKGDAVVPQWSDKSVDTEREGWMIRQIASYLADTNSEGSVSLLAQGISTQNKVYLVDDKGRPAIDLRLPVERAWASLGRALERGEFTVKDLNRDAGMYYVKYEPGKLKPKEGEEDKGPAKASVDEEDKDKPGIVHRMFHWWGDDDELPGADQQYRIEMRQSEKGVLINIQREDGAAFADGEAEYLLGVIKAHLA